jgi:hypothetical protein
MSTLDALIDTGLYYGPGVLLTTAVITAGRGFMWAADRTHQLIDNRAARRYKATADRLHQVASNTDFIIAAADDQLASRLLQQIYADDMCPELDRDLDTYDRSIRHLYVGELHNELRKEANEL